MESSLLEAAVYYIFSTKLKNFADQQKLNVSYCTKPCLERAFNNLLFFAMTNLSFLSLTDTSIIISNYVSTVLCTVVLELSMC